CVRASIGFDVW
nr:immunoglobulin heavy chain junction region [Macaca mulatta]MOW45668.1 immunoglobulin heavy chain junction region [Macaca mulatta]MOW45758.1 immunoglobulin heavy chain junction region [Macaca mulatta]MOW45925.1 immunoglobulin heavy chain junction region [Macaca mulatta]MOW45951.1 immunoglobulin heavy chain junction region [Macaca mulatta]